MKNLILVHLFILTGIFQNIWSQNGYAMNSCWADYQKDSISVSLDIEFMEDIPYLKELSTLLIVEISVPGCDPKTLPGVDQNKNQDQFKYALKEHLEIKPRGVVVGSERINCQQKLYIYLKDTSDIIKEIRLLSEQNPYREWKIKTTVEKSNNWDYYKKHLVPKNLSYEELYMKRMYESLKEGGDPLTPSREITHVFRMESFESKVKFVAYVNSKGFMTDYRSFDQLLVIRNDSASPEHLLPIIKDLRLQVKEFGGNYIGIEIIQINQ